MESEREAARRAIKRRNWLAHLWREWIVESRRPIAPVFAHPTPDTWSDENLTATWIGHSTVLMNFLGVRVLTDVLEFARAVNARLGTILNRDCTQGRDITHDPTPLPQGSKRVPSQA